MPQEENYQGAEFRECQQTGHVCTEQKFKPRLSSRVTAMDHLRRNYYSADIPFVFTS